MTVSVTLTSTGEVFQTNATSVDELKAQIFEQKGIPTAVQVKK